MAIRPLVSRLDVTENASQAFVMASLFEYDLILMDQQMPGMDGPQTVVAIRQLDLNVASVPIIAISTDTDGSDQFRAGVDDFVAKPFDPVRLFDAISRVTGFMPSAPALADIVAGLAAIHEPAPSIAPVAVNPDLY